MASFPVISICWTPSFLFQVSHPGTFPVSLLYQVFRVSAKQALVTLCPRGLGERAPDFLFFSDFSDPQQAVRGAGVSGPCPSLIPIA